MHYTYAILSSIEWLTKIANYDIIAKYSIFFFSTKYSI